MTPSRRDWLELCVPQVPHLHAVVFNLKIQILIAGHQQGLGANAGQCFRKIATVNRIRADVAVLPGPELRKQIRRIASCVVRLPERREVILKRGRAHGSP